jgi:hypothetical protein
MSIQAQQTIAFFEEVKVKTDRLHSLIEQYAAARAAQAQEQFLGPIGRTAVDVNRMLMNRGYGVMADSANQISMLAKRGGTANTKARGLRELINSIRAAMDTNIKIIIAEEAHKQEATDGAENPEQP